MLQVSISDFKADVGKYIDMAAEDDVCIMQDGKPALRADTTCGGIAQRSSPVQRANTPCAWRLAGLGEQAYARSFAQSYALSSLQILAGLQACAKLTRPDKDRVAAAIQQAQIAFAGVADAIGVSNEDDVQALVDEVRYEFRAESLDV